MDVANALTGFGQYLANRQIDRLAASHDALTVFAWQTGKQTITYCGLGG
jgi:hypothetical protein